jgi:hypothetical protein
MIPRRLQRSDAGEEVGGGEGLAVERDQKGVGGRGRYGEEKGMRGGEGSRGVQR